MELKLEVYTPALELVGVLEIQRSVIWAEKAFSAGSFSLESLITEESRALLVPENILWIAGDTAGIIEHVEQQAGRDGPYITVKGRDLTGLLDRRILWGQYNLHGTPAAIMHKLVEDSAIAPTRGDVEARKLPGLVSLAVPVGGQSIRVQKTGGTLLDALEQVGETYQVAFGVRFNAAVPCMEFWTRPGADRSVNQSANEPVFYSTELDDVLESEYSYDSSKYRNVSLVAGEGEGGQRVMVTVETAVEPEPQPPTPPDPPGPTPVQYTITLAVDPEGGGVASGGGTVNEGDSVTVTASPSSGYVFVGWQENGVIVSTDAAYTFQVNSDHNLTAAFADMSTKEYNYTGNVVTTTLYPGVYKLEAWGAEGGYRTDPNYAGKGGYSTGNITITQATVVFIRVGGAGNTGGTGGGFNGGGKRGTYNGGGGASDIRISADDFNHRVIVAGGGGSDGASNKAGGYGGGTAGQNRTDNYGTGGYGGTQTGVSDSSWQADAPSTNTTEQSGAYAGFGFGGNGISSGGGHGGAGGGGWYGGSGSVPDSSGDDDRGGGGGSGFVWTGENAPAGFALTDAYYLTNARTVDGAQSFASPAGTTETGHSGNGYVRITPVAFYVVTVVSEDAAKGTVSGGGRYENGTQVTVSASPTSGYKLSGWYENGEQVSADKNYTFTVSGNRTLTAQFEQASTYTITLSIDPAQADWGSVSGGGQYQEGSSVTVTATPADGYQFVAWQENGQQVSTDASYTFQASGDRALVAVFSVHVKTLSYYRTVTPLASARAVDGAAVEDYALFVGGGSAAVDAYDTAMTRSTPTALSGSRSAISGVSHGAYALFGGGTETKSGSSNTNYTTVYTYNASLTRGTATSLGTGRGAPATAKAGNYALFGGGNTILRSSGYIYNGTFVSVDAYNATLTRTAPTSLSVTSGVLAGTRAGNYALFAGGFSAGGTPAKPTTTYRNTVNAYSSTLERTNPAVLATARKSLAGAFVGDYALFAGGDNGSIVYNTVDVYDSSLTHSTPAMPLSTARSRIAAASIDGYVLFCGGQSAVSKGNSLSVVDAYNETLTRSTPTPLKTGRDYMSGVALKNFGLFAGGYTRTSGTGTVSSVVEVYTVQ